MATAKEQSKTRPRPLTLKPRRVSTVNKEKTADKTGSETTTITPNGGLVSKVTEEATNTMNDVENESTMNPNSTSTGNHNSEKTTAASMDTQSTLPPSGRKILEVRMDATDSQADEGAEEDDGEMDQGTSSSASALAALEDAPPPPPIDKDPKDQEEEDENEGDEAESTGTKAPEAPITSSASKKRKKRILPASISSVPGTRSRRAKNIRHGVNHPPAASTKPVGAKKRKDSIPRRKYRFRPNTMILMDIRRQQKIAHKKLSIPRAAIRALMQQACLKAKPDGLRIQKTAVEAIHQAVEHYIMDMMRDASIVMISEKKQTLLKRHLRVLQHLKHVVRATP